MAENDSAKYIRGYVSAYLKQSLRTFAEVERDYQLLSPSTSDWRISQGVQSYAPEYCGAERRAVKRQ